MKLLASDLDRTMLPNGLEPYDDSLPLLKELVKEHGIAVAYVTARRVESVLRSVMPHYAPPQASYIIGAVGSEIYLRDESGMFQVLHAWEEHVLEYSPQWQRTEVVEVISAQFPFLVLQPTKEQTQFKVSFFLYDLDLFKDVEEVLPLLLKSHFGASALATCSIDLNANLAYVDITPPVVTKISALEYLMNELKIVREQVLFAGDSGNDLSVFLSSLDSVVVANAEDAIKEKVIAEKTEGALYLSKGIQGLNGNYSSGIIEGLLKKGWISSQKLYSLMNCSDRANIHAK